MNVERHRCDELEFDDLELNNMVMCDETVCVARSTSMVSAVEWATKGRCGASGIAMGRCGASGIAIGRCRTPHEHAKSVPIIAEKQKKFEA